MRTVHRLTASLAITVVAALASASEAAAAQPTPTPTPSLSTMLIAPTGTFTESQTASQDGPMTATDYAGSNSLALAELQRDRYVDGYIRSWIAASGQQDIVEEVVAFSGRREAVSWLSTFKSLSASQYLVHPITADGVDAYYGNHYADPTQPLYLDSGAFLKGNDFFVVAAESKADDLGDLATTQAKRQYEAAPAYSIAPNQWPENAGKTSLTLSALEMPLAIGGGAFLVILVLAGLAVAVVVTRGRPTQIAALAPATAAPAGPLMSQDGRYWWDGQAWRDATKEAPPDAMRSGDGYYWWDSRSWRPVPPAS